MPVGLLVLAGLLSAFSTPLHRNYYRLQWRPKVDQVLRYQVLATGGQSHLKENGLGAIIEVRVRPKQPKKRGFQYQLTVPSRFMMAGGDYIELPMGPRLFDPETGWLYSTESFDAQHSPTILSAPVKRIYSSIITTLLQQYSNRPRQEGDSWVESTVDGEEVSSILRTEQIESLKTVLVWVRTENGKQYTATGRYWLDIRDGSLVRARVEVTGAVAVWKLALDRV